MRRYAALINAQGMHALVIDSLSPRGERELCTQRTGQRKVTQTQRRRDALGALSWLAGRPDVDPSRLGLLGWSNGGSAVLAATNLAHPEVQAAKVRASRAVAFYPGCEDERRRGYRPAAPLLLLIGEADDWTPAAPCHALADEAASPRPVVHGYAGAYHEFDGDRPLRLRTDVPNGARPGQGVHVGGDAAAREASRAELLEVLRAMVAPPTR
jgi:dienelactone hydrolase